MRRIGTYLHQHPAWPHLTWDAQVLVGPLASVRHKQGLLLGQLGALSVGRRQEALLTTLTDDVVKSSEIEGEILSRPSVRSSLARHMGIELGALDPIDRRVEGMVKITLDATGRFGEPLTEERLFTWHASLFPPEDRRSKGLTVGAWRRDELGPMQVVSARVGKEQVHYEAPAAERVSGEMARFLDWFNTADGTDEVLRAALAHLWFESIHPFDDGNGRIGRAIIDMRLARSEQSSRRFYSMSAQIRRERSDYYRILERSQQEALDITAWMSWFLGCLDRAIDGAGSMVALVQQKARFWETCAAVDLNERQRQVLNRLLDGFEGFLTNGKYATMAKTSPDTALRDIQELLEQGILLKNPGGGRSTSYRLAEIPGAALDT